MSYGQIQQLRKDLEDAQNGQTMLIDKLIQCCKEVSGRCIPDSSH